MLLKQKSQRFETEKESLGVESWQY